MKVKLVFDDWKLKGKSIYQTEIGVELSANDFHSGTTFDGDIWGEPEQLKELQAAMRAGYTPSFIVMEG